MAPRAMSFALPGATSGLRSMTRSFFPARRQSCPCAHEPPLSPAATMTTASARPAMCAFRSMAREAVQTAVGSNPENDRSRLVGVSTPNGRLHAVHALREHCGRRPDPKRGGVRRPVDTGGCPRHDIPAHEIRNASSPARSSTSSGAERDPAIATPRALIEGRHRRGRSQRRGRPEAARAPCVAQGCDRRRAQAARRSGSRSLTSSRTAAWIWSRVSP